ncbi:hypothetical protein [Acidithiobacillus sp.]|uniref:hypothetical protein n=1 Tax=Acidithiobacillus sp. TaxID=1872118 RepID=UPI0026364BAD|nr:hypothetical protein [Acidithiobacillus sp.]MDD2750388.1 hypothetical protein [Acidithiobacillus sp.]MDD5278975.1 hypothetical protein [Acidithiobacillus sp.]
MGAPEFSPAVWQQGVEPAVALVVESVAVQALVVPLAWAWVVTVWAERVAPG